MTRFMRSGGAEYLAQLHHAAALEKRFHEFASSIGCTVIGDEIQCTEAQGKLLKNWWQENTGGQPTT